MQQKKENENIPLQKLVIRKVKSLYINFFIVHMYYVNLKHKNGLPILLFI